MRAGRRIVSAEQRKKLKAMNKTYPKQLAEVPQEQWPPGKENDNRIRVLRSRGFLVQVFNEDDCLRLSINRTDIDLEGNWKENISWEQIQQLKRQAGYGNMYAVEVYPRDYDIVNVANMRHIWVLEKDVGIGWFKNRD